MREGRGAAIISLDVTAATDDSIAVDGRSNARLLASSSVIQHRRLHSLRTLSLFLGSLVKMSRTVDIYVTGSSSDIG